MSHDNGVPELATRGQMKDEENLGDFVEMVNTTDDKIRNLIPVAINQLAGAYNSKK